jgi:hypothetical protein
MIYFVIYFVMHVANMEVIYFLNSRFKKCILFIGSVFIYRSMVKK